MTRPSPKSLILDLLSTLRRGAMPVRALVAAGELFGITPNSLRVSLARVCSTGQVERDARGRYRLGDAAQAVDGHVQSWRHAHRRMGDWNVTSTGGGSWIAVHAPGRGGHARQRRADARALLLHGFRELESGLCLRPDNLIGGVDAARSSLCELGLSAASPVFGLCELDAGRERAARALWRPNKLAPAYAHLCDELARGEARLRSLTVEPAMVESFLLGGRAIRSIALDPLLPHPIVERGALAALVDATRRYELAGRACWADFLAEYGVVHQRAPVDARVGDAARALPHAAPNEGALA
ncbi:MAG: PaaX family transcriptional regulator [Myxococcota bacterium]|nr:PaaX family transcriptional regulator [Myxococcota bacterium]